MKHLFYTCFALINCLILLACESPEEDEVTNMTKEEKTQAELEIEEFAEFAAEELIEQGVRITTGVDLDVEINVKKPTQN